jgi:phospholipid/cholesterol/gamma-HCH transport system permease protein
MNFLARIGAWALRSLRGWGRAGIFFGNVLKSVPASLRRFGLVVEQIHAIGNLSLLIILASGMAVGFVLALQMYYALVTYGATESLGLIVNLSLVRELGPVVTALLFAGRAGTSLTAEIGLMKAGEQISALELMAIDPRQRVLAPRFLAGIISIDPGNFWSIQQSGVDVWRDVGNGVIKSSVFGVICTAVALYQGYTTEATPEGVAYATTRTVVISSLSVLGMDFILTALMFSAR